MMSRAVVPHMLQAGKGRVITVTTSLGTMVRGGYLLYGASKAAAEAAMAVLAADLEGTGVTCNVLVPGGVTNTPLVGEGAGDPAKMLQPEIMVPPLLWLISDAAAAVTARRFVAMDWDASLPADAGGGEGRCADCLAGDRADAGGAGLSSDPAISRPTRRLISPPSGAGQQCRRVAAPLHRVQPQLDRRPQPKRIDRVVIDHVVRQRMHQDIQPLPIEHQPRDHSRELRSFEDDLVL